LSEVSDPPETESVVERVIPRNTDRDERGERLAESNDKPAEDEDDLTQDNTPPRKPLTLFEEFFDVALLEEGMGL
jgi:hypothetical protein